MSVDERSIPVPDPAPAEFPQLHDIDYFNERLRAAFARVSAIRPYEMKSLGQVDGRDILLLCPAGIDPGKANILSAGGFHGEEPAGPWGILEYLETATPGQLYSVNHSFLPLVNATGFAMASRYNGRGENPSSGFIAMAKSDREETAAANKGTLSAEGEILAEHRELLINLARDGFVTQHEDWRVNEAFLYVNGGKGIGAFAEVLRGVLGRHFAMAADDHAILADVGLKDGVCYNELDDTFESWVHFWGVPLVATTETPGQQPARARIDCNRDIIASFAAFIAKM